MHGDRVGSDASLTRPLQVLIFQLCLSLFGLTNLARPGSSALQSERIRTHKPRMSPTE